jgi:hypothetical protein
MVVLAALVAAAAACGGAGSSAVHDPSHTTTSSHHGTNGGTGKKKSGTTTSTTPSTASAVHPVNGKVTVLEIGDSLGIDLGWGLQWALRNDSHVTLVQDAKGDTGLANTAYYNWPAALESELAQVHPQIVVVFLGGNDPQSFYQGNQLVTWGTPLWKRAYGERVTTIITEATSAGARVLWVGMPIMQPQHLSHEMAVQDAVYRAEASSHPGATYFSSWHLFATPSGQYNGGTTDVAGSVMPLRDADGIHLADGGLDLLGLAVVKEMQAIYKLP